MTIAEALRSEFDRQMAITRRVLERLPEDRLDWRPHAKSWTVRDLATHLLTLPTWVNETIQKDVLEFSSARPEEFRPKPLATVADALARFDRNVASARACFEGVPDERLHGDWSMAKDGRTIMTSPRTAVLRDWVLNHNIHHRAQLGVYLRLLDVPVPQTFGPTADEPGGF